MRYPIHSRAESEAVARQQSVMSRQQLHDAIVDVASKNGAVESWLFNGVSVHKMSQSVSFAQLKAILVAVKQNDVRTFVGTVQGRMVVSVNFNFETIDAEDTGKRAGKKRGRDAHEEAVKAAIDRVKRGVHSEEIDAPALESASSALYSILTTLRGARNETAVESWGLSYKKDEGGLSKAQHPRLVLSLRMSPSVAVPLKTIFRVLGPNCRSDGMLTVQDSESLADGLKMPLSEQAAAAEIHGQKALTLFATVSVADRC